MARARSVLSQIEKTIGAWSQCRAPMPWGEVPCAPTSAAVLPGSEHLFCLLQVAQRSGLDQTKRSPDGAGRGELSLLSHTESQGGAISVTAEASGGNDRHPPNEGQAESDTQFLTPKSGGDPVNMTYKSVFNPGKNWVMNHKPWGAV